MFIEKVDTPRFLTGSVALAPVPPDGRPFGRARAATNVSWSLRLKSSKNQPIET